MKDSRPKIDTPVIDDLLIDELVSGQLTGERYRAALRAFEAQPAKWRDCALAFLEEQALRSELRALAQGTIDWSKDDWSKGTSVEGSGPLVVESLPSPVIKVTSLPLSRQLNSHFKSVLSTAALLLISFTVGWLGSEVMAERRLPSVDSVSNSMVQKTSKTPSEMSPRTSPISGTQFVVDGQGAFDRGIPRAIRELERDGRIRLKTYDMLVPTILNDGSSAFVPVQELILSRGSVESY